MGLLKVTGTLDVKQFWPAGTSDVDTTKVVLKVGADAFRYQPHAGAAFAVTKVFDGAIVKGSVRKPAVDAKGQIIVRLQAADGPELHFRPPTPGKSATDVQRSNFKQVDKDFRQHFGESATVALSQLFPATLAGPVPCTVQTQVETPNDVFDTYGRFIGDVIVRVGSRSTNLNVWMVKQGWAFPTFYTSMTTAEIQTFLKAVATGRKKKGRIWSYYAKQIPAFDTSLVFRPKGPVDAAADPGAVILPKLFRRQATWWAYTQAGLLAKDYKAYIHDKREALVLTTDLLANGVHSAKPRYLDEFLDVDGTFTLRPEDVAFMEATSTLVDASGKKITTW